jgi:3-phenylpropionate/trans-cinnamate dioxygenase ferredoxin subunit
MSDMVKVGKVGELADGAMKTVSTKQGEILLARVGEKYYAADSRCPHMKGRLAEGTLEGTVVTCPLHGSQFDLRNGKVVRWLGGTGVLSRVGRVFKSAKDLKTYRVEVKDDQLQVEL